jgi:hypothetical protein
LEKFRKISFLFILYIIFGLLIKIAFYEFEEIINVPCLKSSFTPKSPKGDFPKLLIFSVLPLGLGAKTIKISSLEAF